MVKDASINRVLAVDDDDDDDENEEDDNNDDEDDEDDDDDAVLFSFESEFIDGNTMILLPQLFGRSILEQEKF